MKRTSPASLIIGAVIGVVAGFLVDQLLTWAKQPTFIPIMTLPIMLALLAAACLLFAWPIRQQLKGKRAEKVDSIRALRSVTLARSSSIVGAVVAGFGGGLLIFLFTRPVTPPVGSITSIGVTIAAAAVLVVCALVAESFCVLPKDDDDDPTGSDTHP